MEANNCFSSGSDLPTKHKMHSTHYHSQSFSNGYLVLVRTAGISNAPSKIPKKKYEHESIINCNAQQVERRRGHPCFCPDGSIACSLAAAARVVTQDLSTNCATNRVCWILFLRNARIRTFTVDPRYRPFLTQMRVALDVAFLERHSVSCRRRVSNRGRSTDAFACLFHA